MTLKLRLLLPSLLSVFLFNSPAKADILTSWYFDINHNQLEFTTDSGVQPKVQLIANPSRLVIDLPGINLEYPKTPQKGVSFIREIRAGQFDTDTTRLVIELAPGYTLDPTKVRVIGESSTRWSVQLPTPELAANANFSPQAIVSIEQSRSEISTPTIERDYSQDLAIPNGSEMTAVKPQIQSLIEQYDTLSSGMFFLDLETGNYLDINGSRIFPAASTIKLPILIAFYQDVDAGKISMNETLVMRPDLVASGSGTMQDEADWTKFSIRETVDKMITISDNTATNMIIDRLGGIAKVNQRFRSWGLNDTVIRNWLGDFQGTNTTSSVEMVRLLAMVVQNKLVSDSSREQVLGLLRHTTIKTLLPAGIGPGAAIADKTGDIGFLVGDAGIIDMPNGRRYLAAIFVKRPYNDPIVRDFVRQISRVVYNYLDRPLSKASIQTPTAKN
ncbi:serine hydrolase [Kamptonema animale CS-326]|jgi:beta-lactamase class A|uniref:serine hydrolase n=1 Tax=Kamptonema animale TaxID=92934 RepID=UPI00232ACDFD|nr:serine hydrolase [Kamptonema animale]MDB9513103.1 serine hydrolase [Kamptonema animale CS-326]